MFKRGTLVKGNSTVNYLTGVVLGRYKPASIWIYRVMWNDKTWQDVFASQITRL